MLGAIEAGGTKFVCGVGTGPHDLELVEVPTGSPGSTMAEVVRFFRRQKTLEALGIASFGPIDRIRGSITSTPKAGWKDFDIVGAFRAAFDIPVGFDTDVNAAALAEGRWGAGRGLTDFVYLTVGTGIGGGAIGNGRILHGTMHAEMGHLRIPHDQAADPFPGCCPYHGDCLEGLASGPALQARWGMRGEFLPSDHGAWNLEAHYLALGIANLVCTLAPQRVLIGGGVMRQTRLFDLIRRELAELLNGYMSAPDVVPPGLGERAGVLGALILAELKYRPGSSR
jgi:fructokinase